jgi:hypothetical protein
MRRTVNAMLVTAVVLPVAYWTLWSTHRSWLASEHTASYDLEHGIFADGVGGVTEAVVVAVEVGFSVVLLRWARTHRAELLGDDSSGARPGP